MKLKEVPGLAKYTCIAYLPGRDDTLIHLVKLPLYGEKGWYRDGISMDGFNRRQTQKIFGVRPHQFQHGHILHWIRDMLREIEIDDAIQAKNPDFRMRFSDCWMEREIIIHESIHAFYHAIGYDYKKKKYVKPIDFTN